MDATISRKMWRTLEPYHGMIYFVPEAQERYEAIGLKGNRMGYFASRSAPMGPVSAEVTIATFFNFNPELVRRVIPAAWDLASVGEILQARVDGADAALRRGLGDDALRSDEMAEAAGLARAATEGLQPDGRPLFAGHQGLPWPAEPHLVLWHAISVLREYRGDGHITALAHEGLTGLQALVMHGASGDVPAHVLQMTRAWPDEAWQRAVGTLKDRGLLGADGGYTDEGRIVHDRYESVTDRLALAPWETLGEERCDRLRTLVRPFSKLVVESGLLNAAADQWTSE